MNLKLFLISSLSLLCLPHSIKAEDTQISVAPTEICETRSQTNHSTNPLEESSQEPVEKSAVLYQLNYMPTYLVQNTSLFQETLTTSDGTIWKLNSSAASTAFAWDFSNTYIVVSPGSWCFSNDYLLTNIKTKESIRATLSSGPYKANGIYILSIDYFNKTLILSDGSDWQIYDDGTLNSWIYGDYVLLGVNSGWKGGSNVLININKNDYLPANKML